MSVSKLNEHENISESITI